MSNKGWIWEQKNWPNFNYDADIFVPLETEFIKGAGVNIGIVSHLSHEQQSVAKVELLSGMAMDTSEIEGEVLDRDSVQASVRKQLGLEVEPRRSNPVDAGIAEMTVKVFETYQEPLTATSLGDWHSMVMRNRSGISEVGRYRTHSEPMLIVSGPDYNQKTHYEAPPSSRVQKEMALFLKWFEESAPGGSLFVGPIVRAGLAHIWFESIHPFEDGNGRIGRAIAEKALAQGVGSPTINSLSFVMLQQRKQYYAALAKVNKNLHIQDWIIWFADMTLAAQKHSRESVMFLIKKTQILDEISGRINTRQEKVVVRLFAVGPKGFVGGLSAANYRSITGASTASVTRDLADLVSKEILIRKGDRKSARYYLRLES